jgi:peptide deformylase
MLKIVEFDEVALRQKTVEVDLPPSDDLKLLAAQMLATMIKAEGIGLAAPQVNRPERIFVALLCDEYYVFVNPTITERSESQGTDNEACLSLPGVTVPVRRAKFVKVEWYDAAGDFKKKKFKRMDARVVQHEMDHLEGKLISDYATTIDVGM